MPLCKKEQNSIVYVALYADNNLMTGDTEAIDETITALKENVQLLKVIEGLQDYFSCDDVQFSMDKKKT